MKDEEIAVVASARHGDRLDGACALLPSLHESTPNSQKINYGNGTFCEFRDA